MAAVVVVPALLLGGVLLIPASARGSASLAGCAGGGTGQEITGIVLSAEQVGNARTIVAVTAARRMPAYAAVVAVATAYQESKLRNSTAEVDHDSEGLYQQRISIYTKPVADDPVKATNAFLDRLLRVPNWQVIPLTVAAQAVQRSAFPDAYAPWQPLATQLVGQLWPAAAAGLPATAALCPGGGAGTGSNVAGSTRIPAGLIINGSPAATVAVRFALAQLGKPYAWGAAGPGAYDCSGLMMAAWGAAGIALPHFTGAQVGYGTPMPTDLAGAVAGDLVFIPGADGTSAAPRHVGMLVGVTVGHSYLIQAPTTGIPVEVTDVSAWAGQIAAVRHVG